MAGAPAYRMGAYPSYVPEHTRRPDVSVVPGSRSANAPAAAPSLGLIVKLAIAVMVVVAVICFGRITLQTMTSTTLSDSSSIKASINAAKSDSTTLEVQNSALSNSSNIKSSAEKLGMSAPSDVETITLEKDVVATDDTGALSLSGSIKNAAETQE